MRGMNRCLATATLLAAILFSTGRSEKSTGTFEALMEKHIQALGGEKAIDSIHSLIINSEIEMIGTGLKGTMKSYQLEPCLMYSEIALGFFTIKRGFDGDRMWLIDQNGKLQFQQDEESKRDKVTSCLIDSYGYISPGADVAVSVLEPDTLDGTLCEVIELVPGNGNRCILYLDENTYLVTALAIDTRQGMIRQTYADYRTVGGVKIPFFTRTEQTAIKQSIEIRTQSIDYNPRIDPVIFLPPVHDVKDYRFGEGHSSLDVAFSYRNRHIYLNVRLDDSDTGEWFMLDSGAGMTVIDSRIADGFDLKRGGTIPGAGAAGTADFELVRIPPFSIRGISFTGQTGISYPISELTKRFSDIEVGGILGYDFLSRFVTRIEYDRRVISFFEPDSFTRSVTAISLDAPLIHNIFAVRGTLEDTCSGTFLIDTGANHSMLLRGFIEENLITEGRHVIDVAILGAGGEESASLARFGSIEIGGIVIRDPVMALSTSDQGIGAFEGISGIIGNDLLEKFTVTLDYKNQRVLLEQNERFEEPVHRDRSGMILVRREDGCVMVHLVIPGAPAEKAGIRAGDEILSIDGQNAFGFESLEEIMMIFEAESGTERNLEIRRGDETIRLTVVLDTYI